MNLCPFLQALLHLSLNPFTLLLSLLRGASAALVRLPLLYCPSILNMHIQITLEIQGQTDRKLDTRLLGFDMNFKPDTHEETGVDKDKQKDSPPKSSQKDKQTDVKRGTTEQSHRTRTLDQKINRCSISSPRLLSGRIAVTLRSCTFAVRCMGFRILRCILIRSPKKTRCQEVWRAPEAVGVIVNSARILLA